MKHRRGLEIGRPQRDGITYLGPILEPAYLTFEDIPEYQALGVYCPKCEREAWLDRWAVAAKWGKRAYLGSLASRLRCMGWGEQGRK
ncbi:hypothetical protein U8P73_36250 (plasmid) [Rhizobium beringeri]|uniref:hypothetical protein n=1 Tax=Rhizobium beringeri TaxID=3019934 RepID=UPI002DDD518D|nr:hypothetical protein [Rhizobium beringeri]WSG93603.1 hypothetical protein U8P73_36250 [Rhizobium beringeri]